MKYNFLRYPGGKTKAVTFSYDDGAAADMRLAETFTKYNLKCTFNLVGLSVERENGLSVDFIKNEILGKGHEVANHGYNHRAQNKIRSLEGVREIVDCRVALEKALGIIIRGFAYPDSIPKKSTEPNNFERIKHYLPDLDIVYARAAGSPSDKFPLPDDWYDWQPTAHHEAPDLFETIDKFLELDVSKLYIAARDPRLLYIWGHAFEFDRNNNWERLEKICESLSGRDDIWYATNIEIYDYVNAYRSLVFSADNTRVYNPTLIEVWFDIDGKIYNIKSGETLELR
ncbi:MAG: polysaccharide deacetylase family protein [Clostridia bacterium]|nr:polysaccharide deacetylase family protein [Clostridia bacterium]